MRLGDKAYGTLRSLAGRGKDCSRKTERIRHEFGKNAMRFRKEWDGDFRRNAMCIQ